MFHLLLQNLIRLQFLEDFLTNLNTIKKRNKLPKHLQQQLDMMLIEFEKKYEGGTNDEQ